MKNNILAYFIIFLAGFLSCILFSMTYSDTEKPLILNGLTIFHGSQDAPSNWINQDDIQVYQDYIVIKIKGASISQYAPTGSMLPTLNENTNGIRVIPHSPSQIQIGDIITFEKDSDLIIHRVIDKGTDEQGIYFITKGDSNNTTDGKIRFEEIKYVTIGLLY
jgi:signal peptidase I